MSNARRLRSEKVKPTCGRCGKAHSGRRGDWNIVLVEGCLAGLLCPTCQTPSENAEAEINAATLDYVTVHGRVYGTAKFT